MDGQNFDNNNYQDNTVNMQNQVPPIAPEPPKQTNALAIVSLVMGILAIVLGCCTAWFGAIPGIAGIICAVFANKQGKSGLATAGMICSIVGIILAILVTIISVVFAAALVDMGLNY